MGLRMGARLPAEVGDFSRFDSPDKVLAYAGLSPFTCQSGQRNMDMPAWRNEAPDTCALPFTMPTKYICI
ncbi:MAG: IS110 family transposase [Oscillospiraceae bacterium]|nr:IS110 family transposase [Oscillospiraceae bacterium]